MNLTLKILLWAQKLALKAGVVVRPANVNSREDLRLLSLLKENDIDTVLDVGANKGLYAENLLKGGFKGKIISFEALPDLYEKLLEKSKAYEGQWIIAPRCAISDEHGKAVFNVTQATSSSSLLKPTETAMETKNVFNISKEIEVETRTITEICSALNIQSDRIFLKLDIQGGEEKALLGAEAMLDSIYGMVVEMPLRPYYDGQATARQLDSWIFGRGYQVWDVQAIWRQPKTGRLDYMDVTYFKTQAE